MRISIDGCNEDVLNGVVGCLKEKLAAQQKMLDVYTSEKQHHEKEIAELQTKLKEETTALQEATAKANAVQKNYDELNLAIQSLRVIGDEPAQPKSTTTVNPPNQGQRAPLGSVDLPGRDPMQKTKEDDELDKLADFLKGNFKEEFSNVDRSQLKNYINSTIKDLADSLLEDRFDDDDKFIL